MGGRERFLHPKSSHDLSIAGDGIFKKGTLLPIQGWWEMWRWRGEREGGGEEGSTLSAIMSFDAGLLASP